MRPGAAAASGGPLARLISGRAPALLGARTPPKLRQRYRQISLPRIAHAFGERMGVRARAVEVVREGVGAAVYSIEAATGERFILKAYLFSDTQPLPVEVLFYQLVRALELPVPVPEVLRLDLGGHLLPCPFYISRHLPGRTLAEILEKSTGGAEDAVAEVGRTLAVIHAVAAVELPDVAGLQEVLLASSRPLGSARRNRRFAACWDRILAADIVSRDLLRRWRDLVENHPPHGQIRLLHGDPGLTNFLISGTRLSGVLDAATRIGFPDEDLVALLTSLWLAQGRSSLGTFRRLLTSYRRAGTIELWETPPLALLAERIVSRLDTYGRTGHLAEKLPLLLDLWSHLSADPELLETESPR